MLLEQVDIQAIRSARFKVVLDYAYGATSFVMPVVLGMLGAEVLSANPYAAAHQSASFDRWEHARGVSALVRAAGAHFGAVLNPDGERITLVDDNGRILSDSEGLMALLSLVLGTAPGCAPVGPAKNLDLAEDRGSTAGPFGQSGRNSQVGPAQVGPVQGFSVALPVSAPTPAQDMCLRAGVELVWTKLSTSHLMEVASRPGVEFAAGQEGGYIFPRFLPAYDAVSALAHTFALLTRTSASLSDVVAGLPQVFSAHEGVVTPWEKKGLVMRSVMELGKDKPTLLIDGVKVIYKDGWALVVPDPEEALTHIWAEAGTETGARARAQDYARHVREPVAWLTKLWVPPTRISRERVPFRGAGQYGLQRERSR